LTFHATFNTFITPPEILEKLKNTEGLARLIVFPEMITQMKSVGLVGRPGLDFRYGNIHAILLGLVLEKVFGESLDKLMRKHLFAPLKFWNTTIDPSFQLKRCVKAQHDIPLGKVSDPIARLALHAYGLIGSAGLFSSTKEFLDLWGLVLLGEQHPTCPIADTFAKGLHLPVTEKRDFAQGFGLWSKFLENLEEFHPYPPDDIIYRSGFSGVVGACSKSVDGAFTLATNFLHVHRGVDEMKVARRGLHETYARVAHCVFG
jgi:CubicO group peptidase (beta-lactamase class C family)